MSRIDDIVAQRELESVIDEEIHRLPEHYRRPLILCCLEGRSYEEAASLLRCSTGTLKSRLARARDQLHQRLCGRGWRVAGVALLLVLTPKCLQAAVPPPLEQAAVQKAGAAGSHPTATRNQLDDLAREVMRPGMAVARFWFLAGALALLLVGVGIWTLSVPTTEPEEPDQRRIPEMAAPKLAPPAFPKLGMGPVVECFPKVHEFPGLVRRVVLGGLGNRVAVHMDDGAIQVRDALNGPTLAVIQGKPGEHSGLALSHDGRSVATIATRDGSLRIFAVATGQAVHVLQCPDPQLPAAAAPVALSADGRWAVCAAHGKALYLWDLPARRLQVLPATAPTAGRSLAFAPDRKRLAAVDAAHKVTLWDLTGEQAQWRWNASVPGVEGIAFAPDGRQLASVGGRGPVRLWEAATGNLVGQFGAPVEQSPLTMNGGREAATDYHAVAFVESKNWLLAANDATIDAWDPTLGKKITIAPSYKARRQCFSGNKGGSLVTAMRDDSTVVIWAPFRSEVLSSSLPRNDRK
jgi:WD40 repeat protein